MMNKITEEAINRLRETLKFSEDVCLYTIVNTANVRIKRKESEFKTLLKRSDNVSVVPNSSKQKLPSLDDIFPTRDEVMFNRRDKTRGIKLGVLNEIYFSVKTLVKKKLDNLSY
jgi:hypothetical protein